MAKLTVNQTILTILSLYIVIERIYELLHKQKKLNKDYKTNKHIKRTWVKSPYTPQFLNKLMV